MLENLTKLLKQIVLLEYNFMVVVYMVLRGFIIYISSMLLIKYNKKLLGTRTPTNFILFIMLGSIAAAAVTGDAPFLPVLLTIMFLIFFNIIISGMLYFFPSLENFFIGSPELLVKHGNIQWHIMRKHFITKNDLINALHQQLNTNNMSEVSSAYLETDGTINFITNKNGK